MNILVIFAHPNKKSLSYALMQAFSRGAKKAKHKVQVIDLYKDRFNPVLSANELKGNLSPQVKRYQAMIEKADWMVFIFPVWWFGVPSILEGWFDRVFTVHFAFKFKPLTKTIGIPIGLLPCKKAVVIETYGSVLF